MMTSMGNIADHQAGIGCALVNASFTLENGV